MSVKEYIPKPIRKCLGKIHGKLHRGKSIVIYKTDEFIYRDKMSYNCPCCGIKLRTFISLGFEKHNDVYNPKRYEGMNQNVICPICNSLPRHRILATWLDEHKNEFNGKILYFAVENGILYWMRRNKVKCTTADLFRPADLKLDIENTHQPDESWDWVICNHVLEHVNDYKKALKEIHRILKPGGKLICSFPILESMETLIEETEHTEENKEKRLELYGQADHLRIFGRDSDEILRQAGFEVSRIDGANMPESILPIVGPGDYDVNYLFLCRKV